VGYLLAGILIGPATPGFVADVALAGQLAEIGVMLLMFGVGLHFSLDDLLAVRKIALPGAIVQMRWPPRWAWALAHCCGAGAWAARWCSAWRCRWPARWCCCARWKSRGMLDSFNGRIAVGWLVVEDLVMVLVLVLLPALAAGRPARRQRCAGGDTIAVAHARHHAAAGGRLRRADAGGRPQAVPVAAVAGAEAPARASCSRCACGRRGRHRLRRHELFGVSFALGAFFAGMVLRESEFSHRAAEESLPLRDAFAVLFFVSVGMLFDPRILVEQPLQVLAVVAIIMFGKSLAAACWCCCCATR
jgi:CPA2 family monovalent cation:H+ antiporter-2